VDGVAVKVFINECANGDDLGSAGPSKSWNHNEVTIIWQPLNLGDPGLAVNATGPKKSAVTKTRWPKQIRPHVLTKKEPPDCIRRGGAACLVSDWLNLAAWRIQTAWTAV
jgi:hypothetical protein